MELLTVILPVSSTLVLLEVVSNIYSTIKRFSHSTNNGARSPRLLDDAWSKITVYEAALVDNRRDEWFRQLKMAALAAPVLEMTDAVNGGHENDDSIAPEAFDR